MVWQSNDSDSSGYLKPLIQYALLNNQDLKENVYTHDSGKFFINNVEM